MKEESLWVAFCTVHAEGAVRFTVKSYPVSKVKDIQASNPGHVLGAVPDRDDALALVSRKAEEILREDRKARQSAAPVAS